MLVPNTLVGISLPILSNLLGQADEAGHRRASWSTIMMNAGTTATLALGTGLLSPLILAMYGSAYQAGTMTMWLLALSAVPAAFNYAASQVLASCGRVWVTAALTAGWAIAVLALALLLVPAWHAGGLALAQLLSLVAQSGALACFLFPGGRWRPQQPCRREAAATFPPTDSI